ncbi:MAG: hypothetical protein ACRDG8_04710 [Actinomycetota bacterium]
MEDGMSVYKTETGMIFRVSESQEGHISVETLDDTTWVSGRIGMVGLRVLPTTVRLTARQVLALPV